MGRLNKLSLKQTFFWLTFWCMLAGLILAALTFSGCIALRSHLAPGDMVLIGQGSMRAITSPEISDAARRLATALEVLQLLLPFLLLLASLVLADVLFYRYKLKAPITALQSGAQRIMENDPSFPLTPSSQDELGMLCTAFEAMPQQLAKNTQELWRQAEERKRLNAACRHDLRNPIAVLKGTVQMMQKQRLQNLGANLTPEALQKLLQGQGVLVKKTNCHQL